MLSEIDQIIHQEIDLQGPGVALAVVKNGELIHSQGYGLANLEWDCPIQPNTVFQLASITKQFTATAIMLLEQQGKLRLDDSITTYLPDYPTHDRTITITHLLNHTSGIPSYTGLESFVSELARKAMSSEDLPAYFKDLPLEFEPGTRFLYNNSGYHLLGLIIEKVAGMNYEDFIQQSIFQPLDMHHSYYMHNKTVIPHRASGYDQTPQGYQQTEYLNMLIPYAAGSLGSTIEDLVRWDAGLHAGHLLDKAAQERMYTPVRLADGSTEPYGFGFGIHDYKGHRLIHHGGGIFGFHTFISRFVDDKTMIAILANNPGINVEKITRRIADHIFEIPTVTRTPMTLSTTMLDKTVGTYLIEARFPVEIVRNENGLLLSSTGLFEYNLLPISHTTYYASQDEEVEVHFSDEQDGTYNTLTLNIPLISPFSATRKQA